MIVTASYKATGPEQLSLEKGQLIQVKKKNSSGWWEGETQVKGKKKEVGWFPATYVKPLNAPAAASDASVPTVPDVSKIPASSSDQSGQLTYANQCRLTCATLLAGRVISIYPFKAQHDDELSFEANEVIKILSKDDPTWWKGEIQSSGAVGLFPANHVQDYKCEYCLRFFGGLIVPWLLLLFSTPFVLSPLPIPLFVVAPPITRLSALSLDL